MSFSNIVVALLQPRLEVPNSIQFAKTGYQTLPELEHLSDLSGQTSKSATQSSVRVIVDLA
jgi:hypothetical protein